MMSSPTIKVNIDTVIIQTPCLQKLAEFYRRGLMLPDARYASDDHTGFQVQGTYLGFDRIMRAPTSTPGPVSLWFKVDEIHTTFERFRQLGGKVIYPPTKTSWGDVLAAIFDPDGNVIGLSQS
jgi:predicted enzyme related to lactoylglutathione lyase